MTDTIPCQVTYTYKSGVRSSYLITMELNPQDKTARILAMSKMAPNPETGLERHLLFGRTVAPRDLPEYELGTFTELAEYAAYLAYLRLEGVSRD